MARWWCLVCVAWLSVGGVRAEEEKKAPSPKQQAQRERMKACNKEAGEKQLKGAERKKFMSACLKGG